MVWTEEIFNEKDFLNHTFLITIIYWQSEAGFYGIFIKEVSAAPVEKTIRHAFNFLYHPGTGCIKFVNTDKEIRAIFFAIAPKIFAKENEWTL